VKPTELLQQLTTELKHLRKKLNRDTDLSIA